MSPQDLITCLYEAINNRSIEQFAREYFHPEAVIQDVPSGREGRGPDGFVQNMAGWLGAMPDARAEVIDMQVAGNTVNTRFRATGTFTGEMMSPQGRIPGTGKKLDMEFHDVHEVQDGKVMRDQTTYDMAEMMRQLGLG